MRGMKGIFVEADAPEFLENEIEAEREIVDLNALNVHDLLADYRKRQANFDTAPFDPEGHEMRFFPGGFTIWSGFPGTGKCLGIDTPILMFDGTAKAVQDVAVGDQLMGPDSFPRRVLSLARGREMLYRVTPVKGDAYVVNESHILSLKQTSGRSEKIVNISVRDYLKKGKPTQEKLKGWRAGVDFRYTPVPLSPYFLGAWLGDGSINGPTVYKPDEEIMAECESVAAAHSLRAVRFTSNTCPSIRISGIKGAANPVFAKLRELGVTTTKHVPLLYRANSRKVRLEVLAGLMDTDGAVSCGGFDFISIEPRLAADVAYLARSLGLAAYVKQCEKSCQTGATGTYHRVSISGDCSIIPTRIHRKKSLARMQIKRVTVTGISVDPIGVGDYFGFEITGDGLFMLGDFTVTHNTTLLRQFACHLMRQKKAVFIASLEENPMDVFYRLACVALGTENPTEDGLQWCVDCWHDKLRLWSYRRGIAETGRILAVIRVLAKQGVRHAIVDSLARLDVHSGDWEAQRQFGNALEATAAVSGTHIHLVAHPRKLVSADQEPDINDVAGSADIGRLADNVLFVRRHDNDSHGGGEFTGMHIYVRKQRYHNGACPTIKGFFNRKLRQYKPHIHDIHVTQYLPKEAYESMTYEDNPIARIAADLKRERAPA